jgi:Xaa-Pro aminopeptidase
MKASVKDFVQLERLARQMDALDLDAIVARAGINFTYLAGFAYPGTLARHLDLADSPRGVYLLWPRSGEPVIVTNAIAEGLARRDSFIEQFEVYEGYSEPPIERLAKVIAAMGLAGSKIGFETNFISAADWETLRARLPQMRTIDSTELMDVVRAVKTPRELALLKRGADMLDDAFLACFPTVRPGMRERDLHAALVGYCLAHGSEFTHGILNSERNTIQYAGESDFAFAAGDAIRTDYVSYMQGYPGHQSRCAVVGRPSDEQNRQYAVIRDIYRAANDQLVPGRTAGEVYQFVVERFAAAGIAYTSMLAGHSVGAWWHQQEPVIARGNPRRLEEGMVIAMEPHVNHWHIQDMLVIRADGPELISDKFSTEEIFACGG